MNVRRRRTGAFGAFSALADFLETMAEWGFNVHVSAASPVLTYAVLRPVPPPAPPDTVPAVMPLPVPLMWDARLAFARLWQLYRRLIQVLTLPDSFRWRSEPMPPIVKELATDCRIEIGIRRPVGTVANDTDDVWLGGKVAGGSPARITCGSVETGVHKVVMRTRRSAMHAHTRETDRGRE